MSQQKSQIGVLTPMMAQEPHRNELLSKLRYAGSRQMMLRRPNRSPDYARPYVPGDPVRFLDWRAFARSDQLIVREVRDRADISVRIFLDTSDSMFWPDRSIREGVGLNAPTKFELAVRLALTTAAGYVKAADVVRLYWGDPHDIKGLRVIKLTSVADVINFYQDIERSGFMRIKTPASTDNRLLSGAAADFGMVFSDAFKMDGISSVVAGCGEIALFHVISALEIESHWMPVRAGFFDHASAGVPEYSGADLKRLDNFDRAVARWREATRSTCRDYSWHYLGCHDRLAQPEYFGFLERIERGGGLVVRG